MNHIVTSSTKVYLRHRENYPETIMMASAYEGFKNLGAEVVPFYWVDDIDTFEDLGPETMVVGYIGDIHRALRKINKPIPGSMDYPESLSSFLGREISKTTLGEIRSCTDRLFIKPVEHKLFTGFVWEGCNNDSSRRRIVMLDDTTEVYRSQTINIVSEYRAMILNSEILDVRRYKGDWSLAADKKIVEDAVNAFQKSGEAPASYTLDFGIVSKKHHTLLYKKETVYNTTLLYQEDDIYETILIEANDGYAFGNYGLLPEAYASCLAARWREMVSL